MILHHNKEMFEQLILFVSEDTTTQPAIIEKDYYVTAFLKLLVEKQPKIIFKGGTSLSKCYKLIQRFSEDIDLSLECENKPTVGEHKALKTNIISVIDEFEFTLTNPDSIKSRMDYNKYIIDFSSVFNFSNLKQKLIVESSLFLRSYPIDKMQASSLIYDYLKREGREDIIAQFYLEPFLINVQDIRRTFIEKIFAICDYYLDEKITEHSRHIYDLYKLYDALVIDKSLQELFIATREERSTHATCLSAGDGIDIKALLKTIVDQKIYKHDYETITEGLLFEKVPYDTAIQVLEKILDSGLLHGYLT